MPSKLIVGDPFQEEIILLYIFGGGMCRIYFIKMF